jgi:hypothetical protein
MIVIIPGNIGGGDIQVRVSDSPTPDAVRHSYLTISAQPSDPTAEIGEIILVRDQAQACMLDAAVRQESNIEEQDGADGIISTMATIGARSVDGVKRANITMNRSTFLAYVVDGGTDKARLLAAAGELDAALSVIQQRLAKDPDNAPLQDQQRALIDLRRWN